MDVATVWMMLGLLAVALALFWLERVPPELVALGLLLSLIITGLLPAERAFAGFASDTVITILGLLVMTSALLKAGAVDMVGRAILRVTGDTPRRLAVIVMTAAASMSSFVSNTACTAFFMPTVLGIARRARLSPSRLLMGLAFASILASSVTLVATSTNLVVSGLMQQSGLAPLGMFELTPIGLPILAVGLVYMLTIGWRLIPERAPAGGEEPGANLRGYLTELVVLPGSRLAARSIGESGLGSELRLTVLGIDRAGRRQLLPGTDARIEVGDVLLVEGAPADLAAVAPDAGVEARQDSTLSGADAQDAEVKLSEAIVMPGCALIGRRLRQLQVRARFGVQVLAISREDATLMRGLADERLRVGDILLIQGDPGDARDLAEAEGLRLLGETVHAVPKARHALIAAASFAGALILASTGLLAFPAASMLGALAVMATRCITPDEAWREVHWRSIVLIACMLGVGSAIESTGTGAYLAGRLADLVGDSSPVVLLGGVFALTVALTQPLSNQAAAAIVLPVAIPLAHEVGQDPRRFAVVVAVAASCSFLTPLEPSCLMVHGPGRFRFSDYLRVGLPLTVLIAALVLVIVPWWWG